MTEPMALDAKALEAARTAIEALRDRCRRLAYPTHPPIFIEVADELDRLLATLPPPAAGEGLEPVAVPYMWEIYDDTGWVGSAWHRREDAQQRAARVVGYKIRPLYLDPPIAVARAAEALEEAAKWHETMAVECERDAASYPRGSSDSYSASTRAAKIHRDSASHLRALAAAPIPPEVSKP